MKSRIAGTIMIMFVVASLPAIGGIGEFWPAAAQEPERAYAWSDRFAGAASAADTGWAGEPRPYRSGEVVVKFRRAASGPVKASMRDRYAAVSVRSLSDAQAELWRVTEGTELEIARQLMGDADVQYAEPNYLYYAADLGRLDSRAGEAQPDTTRPNDPDLAKQWAHPLIRSFVAWDITTGSPTVTVAILDSGIDEDHPDLRAKVVAGYDFVDGDTNPHDTNGHGTHVAGIAAAATNNAIGVAGMDWQARIMPIRVLDWEGAGSNWDIGEGVRWATQHGADVINLSLGGPSYSEHLRDAISEAYAAGALVVASMGNSRQEGNPTMYPAAYPNVMAVAATGRSDAYAPYSSFGPHCDISAPGGDMYSLHDSDGIYSTLPTYPVYMNTVEGYYTNYDYVNGTSQAAPYVAGLAALVWAADPTLTVGQVEQVIKNTADDLGSPGYDHNYGYGRINALKALQAVGRPQAPNLAPISNPENDGAYEVDWTDVPNATGYTLQEANDQAFTWPTIRYTGAASRHMVSGQKTGEWYYRVRASNSAGDGRWSNVRSVTVKPVAPTLATIENADKLDTYVVRWSAVPGAAGYTLHEASSASFNSPETRYVGDALQYRVTGQPGGTWYYRVRAHSWVGDSTWSESRSTKVDPAALQPPQLQEIDNGDGNGEYVVDWLEVTGATRYLLEESRDPYFSDPTEVYAGSQTEFPVTNRAGGTWHYRVRALGTGNDKSPWSNTREVVVPVRVYLTASLKGYVTQSPAVELVNGDFEAGRTGWVEFSSSQSPLIMDSNLPQEVRPHSGRWLAWLGGAPNEVSTIEQQITVPTAEPYLVTWYWIQSEELFCLGDTAQVLIDGVPRDSLLLCPLGVTAGWKQRSLDLGVYAGQSVALQFRVETNARENSNLFLDDVAFQATASAWSTAVDQELLEGGGSPPLPPGKAQEKPRFTEP